MRSGVQAASTLRHTRSLEYVIARLGGGAKISTADTVPIALWCVAIAVDQPPIDFADALCLAVQIGSDRDTIAAIIGGCLGTITRPPGTFRSAREPLPSLADFS